MDCYGVWFPEERSESGLSPYILLGPRPTESRSSDRIEAPWALVSGSCRKW